MSAETNAYPQSSMYDHAIYHSMDDLLEEQRLNGAERTAEKVVAVRDLETARIFAEATFGSVKVVILPTIAKPAISKLSRLGLPEISLKAARQSVERDFGKRSKKGKRKKDWHK